MKPSPVQWSGSPTRSDVPVAGEPQEPSGTVQFSPSQLTAARWDDRNEARPGAPRRARPDERRLRGLGYTLYGVGTLKVLNNLSDRDPDPPLGEQPVGPGHFDVVCSGTFIYELRGRDTRLPAGPVMRHGRLDTRGVEKGQRRGAIAVLADRTIRLARTGGASGECSLQTLQDTFGMPGNPLVDLCGGGALLIERGARVPNKDLHEVQRFESGAGGFQAPQLRMGLQLAVGICEGTCWLLVGHSHNGETVQSDMFAAGFGSLVLLDGGSGGFLRDVSGTPYEGRDVQGFGITLRT